MLPSRIFFDNFLDDIDTKKNDKMMMSDIYEEGDTYHVVMDLPGFNKDDISILFENGYLKVRAMHKMEEKDNKKYVHRERISTSKCERSFYFGEMDEKDIKAEFKDGILKISIPKKKEEKSAKKYINID